MASAELLARLRYLNESAHLLAVGSPSTSRYLMLRSNSLMFDGSLELSDSQRQEVCGACGTIMVIGWQSSVRVESRRLRRQRGTYTNPAAKEIVLKCELCDRNTRFNVDQITPRRIVRRVDQAAKIATTRPTLQAESGPGNSNRGSANSNSKKRAKARKGGLGALLANKKATDTRPAGFGLDLMDFMKKS
jgi:ribonuclease MRP protein subunit SNM1